jgi:translation elongation factor EF-1beta
LNIEKIEISCNSSQKKKLKMKVLQVCVIFGLVLLATSLPLDENKETLESIESSIDPQSSEVEQVQNRNKRHFGIGGIGIGIGFGGGYGGYGGYPGYGYGGYPGGYGGYGYGR